MPGFGERRKALRFSALRVLTGNSWACLKVLQTAYNYKQLQPTEFEDSFVLGQGEPFAKNRSIPELSVVALRHPVECKGGVLPQGGKGTVVHVIVTASTTRSSLRIPSLARSRCGATTSIG